MTAGERDTTESVNEESSGAASGVYGEWYFQHCCGVPYERSDHWLTFFGRIADWIVRELRPASVLDAGCAMGFLVEALRDRGVEAEGVDISPYAIEKVREDIAPYCWVGSLTDHLPRRYDLVVCIEVLEHLTEQDGRRAVENLCRATDDILMSSTPYDRTERTHVNVQPPEYWASLFAEYGFFHDPEFDTSAITPWATRFQRRDQPVHQLIVPYERRLWQLSGDLSSLRQDNESLHAETHSLRNDADSLRAEAGALRASAASLEAQRESLRSRVVALEAERDRLNLVAQHLERDAAAAQGELSRVREALGATSRAAQVAQEQLALAQRRLSFRLLERVWETQMRLAPPTSRQGQAWLAATRLARRVARAPLLSQPAPVSPGAETDAYEAWVAECATLRFNRDAARQEIEGFTRRPRVSIIMPVYNPPEALLRGAIDSVIAQSYEDWELCVCDDASTEPHVRSVLGEYEEIDSRIRVRFSPSNSGISRASNEALGLATGEYIGLLDHDDELTPDALFQVVSTLLDTDADLVYSDEDKRNSEGRLCDPFFKPSWSPDLLLSVMYTSHFSVYRKSLVDEIGGFRPGYEGSQDYDLALRFTERASTVAHIPRVLYHWRTAPGSAAASGEAKPYAYDAAQRALTDALQRRGIAGECRMTVDPGFYRVRREIVDGGLVSVIIPTRDRVGLLRDCISSIDTLTDYPNYEIIIVDNGSTDPETLDYLSSTRHRVIRDSDPFSHSRLNNVAAAAAAGDYLLLLNNDTEIISPEWMTAMVEHAQRPEVGAVGAKLLYPDGRVQHGGVVLGLGGPAGNAFCAVTGREPWLFNLPNVVHNTTAVTGACLMVRADLYRDVGGLDDDNLPVAYNDVDLCLRIKQRGYEIVYTPYALVRHHESISRGLTPDWRAATYLLGAYPREIAEDEYYSPNLTLTRADHTLDTSKVDSLACMAFQPLFMSVTGPLTQGVTVGQEFTADRDALCAIGVKFSTAGTVPGGTVRLRLYESVDSDSVLATAEEDASLVTDGDYHTFYFEPLESTPGQRFYFELEHVGNGAGSLSVWKSDLSQPPLGRLFVNRVCRDGALTFRAFAFSRGGRALPASLRERAVEVQ